MSNNKLEIINPLEFGDWDEMISNHPDTNIFHSMVWAKVLNESYGYRPHYFTKIEADELKVLVPIMEVKSFITGVRGVSLPFTDYCPPLIRDGFKFEDIFPQLTKFGETSRWKHLELRGVQMGTNGAFPSASFLTHTLPLSADEKEIRSRFKSSTVRNIKRAVKEEVEVTKNDTFTGIKEFYRLNSMTRKNHGLPPQPFHFFKNLYKYILTRGFGTVFLASCQGKIVAALICLHFGKKAIYKYGASDKRFQAARANNLVMWEAIRHYALSGFQSFCFGRTELQHKGLIQFKAGWGTHEDTIHYLRFDLNSKNFIKESSKTIGWHNRVFSHMPIPALNALGTVLYRHMG